MGHFLLAEIAQNKFVDRESWMDIPFARPANANFQAKKIVGPERFDQRFDTVMTAGSSASDKFYPPRSHIEIVMNNQQSVRHDFKESVIFGDRPAAPIHIGDRFDEMHLGAANTQAGREGVPLFLEHRLPPPAGQFIDNHKSDVMAVLAILRSGIAEPDD